MVHDITRHGVMVDASCNDDGIRHGDGRQGWGKAGAMANVSTCAQ